MYPAPTVQRYGQIAFQQFHVIPGDAGYFRQLLLGKEVSNA
jgi:hypothetical protein